MRMQQSKQSQNLFTKQQILIRLTVSREESLNISNESTNSSRPIAGLSNEPPNCFLS